jgi:DNA-binding NarL/FixJ family response regulator
MDAARRNSILTAYERHSRRFDEIASRHVDPPALESTPVEVVDPLSDRQLEVLRLVAEGLSNHQICLQLEVTLETVKTHVLHIYQRLHARNRAHAVHLAHAHRLLD